MFIRKKSIILVTIVLASLLLVACSNAESTEVENTTDNIEQENRIESKEKMIEESATTGDAVDVEEAERIYTFACASCHGNDLAGQGPFPAMINVGSKYTEEEIKTIIIEGIGTMPPGRVTPDEANTVAKWLSETQS